MKKFIMKVFLAAMVLAVYPGYSLAVEKSDLQRGAWWGEVNTASTAARREPTAKSVMLGAFSAANRVKVLKEVKGEDIGGNDIWYQIDGGRFPGSYVFSGLIDEIEQPQPPQKSTKPENVDNGEYWVDVDLTRQVLTLFRGDRPEFVTYVSSGKSASPTITGTYRVWYKARKVRMNLSPPVVPKAYDLPNVPNSMFYHGSYAIHGTYWHDNFTTPQSSGCTNITQGDAEYLFSLIKPELQKSQKVLLATESNKGTVIVNHY